MAKGLIEIAVQLASKLGANTSKFMGTRSNVSFLGSGPKDGMLFQKDINPESFAALGTEKVLPIIESSMAYATGGKLNDIQLEKLIKNLKTMDETVNPTNIVEMGNLSKGMVDLDELNFTRDAVMAKRAVDSSGIDSLRAKSGLGERQATEAASDAADVEGLASLRDRTGDNNVPLRSLSEIMRNPRKMADEAAFPGETFKATPDEQMNIRNSMRDMGVENLPETPGGIMASVERGDLPAKTGAAREFLVNTLKVGDEASSTTLSDIISAKDFKAIMEGGGGAEGDPLVLVQKYFGPRIAEMIPNGGTTEEIAIFTKRVMNNVEDAKGFRPDEPEFDAMTAMFVDNKANGGRAGYAKGGLAKILEL